MFLRCKREKLQKLWLMSKWTFLFVFLGIINTHGTVYSQSEQQVTISMKNAYLKDILWAIQRQTTFVFMYHEEDLDKVGKVNVEAKASTVEKILSDCLKGTGLTYVFQNEVIVLKPLDDEKKKEIRIAGKVTDEEKAPLPGVTIMVKGTNLGTATNAEGRYSLTLPEMKGITLLFSFVGMEPREVKYTGKDTIDVVMREDKVKMDEVVVTGYMNVRKESFTGNATTVTRDQLMKVNNKNVIAALQAFDPSFRIKENNIWGSDPNALPEFNIRGESSIAVNKGLDVEQQRRNQRTNLKDNPNMPVFILDGFEVSVEKIYDMDMNRIESMTILKDAAATALYGSRAANGVVVVTTVAPKPGEMQITYNFTGGGDFPDLSDYNLCNASEMLEVERRAGLYTDPNSQATADIDYNGRMQQILRGVDTYWLGKPLRNVFNHKHSLNLQGGEETIRYSLDLNYDSNNGVMKGSYRSRTGAGLTLDYRPKRWLQMMNSITYNRTSTEDSPYGTFSTYASMKPYLPIHDENGDLLQNLKAGSFTAVNPLYAVKYLGNYSGKGKSDDITNNLNINMYFWNDFQFKGQFSITKTTSKTETFKDPKDAIFQQTGITDEQKGSLDRTTGDSWSWNVNAMLYYNKTVGKHHFINATLGMNAKEAESETVQAKFVGFGIGGMNTPIFAADQPDKSQVSASKSRLIGFLGSVNYSYDDIYLFDASFRFDASSQFGKDKRWAPFWSVGGGINFHNYKFLKDNWLISTLKIRATYGSTGNVNFPISMATTTYQINTDSWFFTGAGAQFNTLGNPRLTWEKTNTVDAGFTIALLNDLIYLDASYYCKKTEDLIDEISVRHSSGFKTYNINSGAIKNEGFEISMNTTVFRNNDWMVTLNANLGANKNKITKLGEETKAYNEKILNEWNQGGGQYSDVLSSPVILYYEGASTSAMYAVRSEGIDPANGRERFIKKNGLPTYTWDANDQVVVGDNNPDAQGSVGLNVAYKGFYLNASFMYQWGAQSYNETLLNKVENADVRGSNVDRRVLTQRWMNPGDIAPFYDMGNQTKTQVTTRFVQDYDYFNFSGLSLGYDFSRELISKWRLRSLGLRFNMNDICRWSTVKEERGTSYPFSRSFSFTLNIGI